MELLPCRLDPSLPVTVEAGKKEKGSPAYWCSVVAGRSDDDGFDSVRISRYGDSRVGAELAARRAWNEMNKTAEVPS